MQQTPVLIIGGSLVGLSAALFLSWRGVPVVVVEKHRGSSPHPRATGFTELTLEHFRAVGIDDHLPQVTPGTRLRRVKAESLIGRWHEEILWTPGEEGSYGEKASPCSGSSIAQDKLEPILRRAALKLGADLRLGTELLSFEQTAKGVTAHVRHRDTDERHSILANYMIAADGADSPIRERLGIERRGVGYLRTLRSVLFRCPEADQLLDRGVQQFQIEREEFSAFLTSYGDGRWVLMFSDDRDRSNAELDAAVQLALGQDMAFERLATGRWEMAGRIAERYSHGRIFLAGDAAHQLPPTRGGFGANTGIDDVYNLAWKLEWVIKGRSKPSLLDTYSQEREPIGWLRHQQTFARPDYAQWLATPQSDEPIFSNEAMELGQRVQSPSIIGSTAKLPPADLPSKWAGQPGVRAPHLWVSKDGCRISTIDLFRQGFVLLSADARWIAAAKAVASTLGVDIEPVHIGSDVLFPEPEMLERHFGIAPDGASLIRPDGVVGWRSSTMVRSPEGELGSAFKQIADLQD